jgi:tetratricopeptide (TPR) repeat protein
LRRNVLICIILVAVIAAGCFAQAYLERSSLGSGSGGGQDTTASQVNYLDFLGGVRQFIAYVLWVRTDSVHHAYYGELGAEAELIPYYYVISWLDPHYVDSYYTAGLTIFFAGSEQEAIDFTRQGIAANPDSGDLYASLGDLYMRQNDYELARAAYRDALDRQLELVDQMFIVNGIASASIAMGDLAGAIAAKTWMLDEYRFILERRGLDLAAREYVVNKVNGLTDEIRVMEDRQADSGP